MGRKIHSISYLYTRKSLFMGENPKDGEFPVPPGAAPDLYTPDPKPYLCLVHCHAIGHLGGGVLRSPNKEDPGKAINWRVGELEWEAWMRVLDNAVSDRIAADCNAPFPLRDFARGTCTGSRSFAAKLWPPRWRRAMWPVLPALRRSEL